MVSKVNLAELCRFYEIDEDTLAILKAHKDFLLKEFSTAADAVYGHLRTFLDASSPYHNDENVAYSKANNLRHWEILFDGRFDKDYEASVAAIFKMRSRLGLEQQWSSGSYSFVLARMLEGIALRLPAKRFEFLSAHRHRAELQTAFFRVATLDMAYVMNGYMEATRDERHQTLSRLAQSFENAVGGIVDGVAAAAERLRNTADVLSHSAEATNSQSMAAAIASKEAASSVQAVAMATDLLSHAIGEISAQVHESNQIASRAAGEADQTHAAVHSLAEAAERIGGIIDLISNIAAQTNMLALNATIEAARAGEAGRGFAIVAQEVKGLAHATSKATAEIGAQVAGIQDATLHVESFIASIAKTVQQVSAIAIATEAAVAQQDAVTQEISRRVREASRGTHEVTSNIVGATQAASDSSAAAKELLKSATDLTGQSEVLSKQVRDFLGTVRVA